MQDKLHWRPATAFLSRVASLASFTVAFAAHVTAQEILWNQVGHAPSPEFEISIRAFSPMHDMDGDGVGDFLYGTKGIGLSYIRSGADGSLILRHRAPNPGNLMALSGYSTANVGDFDGDGIPDYAIGAPFHEAAPLATQGIVRIFSGVDFHLLHELLGQANGQHLGTYLDPLGDINGDGFEDFAAGGGFGAVSNYGIFIFGGPDGALLRTHQPTQEGGTGRIKRFVDVDGDGRTEYLLGRPWDDTFAPNAGAVDVISGSDGSVQLRVHGRRTLGLVGYAMSSAGDWNSDGIQDIAAGASGTGDDYSLSTSELFSGVYIFSGADGSILSFFDGEGYVNFDDLMFQRWPAFGARVASGRDLTGDGFPDLVVGAPLDEWTHGSVFVFSGATGSLIWKVVGADQDEDAPEYGAQVEVLADHNGDGIDDWALNGPFYYPPGVDYGAPWGQILVFAGAPAEATPLCQGGVNSTGEAAHLWNSGPIALATNSLVLDIDHLPAGAPGLLVFGSSAPAAPFGAGELCVASDLVFVAAASADAAGNAQVPVDLFAPPFPQAPGVLRPGDVGTFQFLYRDGATRNATQALEVLFPY